MNKLILLPYKSTSGGANNIANALGVPLVPRGEFLPKWLKVDVVNWGRGDLPSYHDSVARYINHPTAVMKAIDKLNAFKAMSEAGNVPLPEWTLDITKAKQWLTNHETIAVVCRQELQGREGVGIVIARSPDQVVPAKLYTKYARKVNEYRVHVMKGEVFYVNVKAKKTNAPANAEPLVRSGNQGWFFVHLDEHQWPSVQVQVAAINAVAALGLDFGGVDIGDGQDGVRVYEVNTAPESGPNTTIAYKAAFKKHFGEYYNNNDESLAPV